jgi:hypothetical protein
MATARKSSRKGYITITLDDTEARYLYSLIGHHTPWGSPMRSLYSALDNSPIGYHGTAMQESLWKAQPKGRPLQPLPLPDEDDE